MNADQKPDVHVRALDAREVTNSRHDEAKLLAFWERERIYQKSKKQNSKGESFYMMDGPPYATGHIHLGTALNKILKDITIRSRRLMGYDVFDRVGYDTHGVPIEFQVEKEIGSTGKQDIERFGVKAFVERCKQYATEHITSMNAEFKNLGVWMDYADPYLTLSDAYIDGLWAVFKEAVKKQLLYLGKYPVHVCTRCETAVAFNEIEYGKQKDMSVYVKFPLRERKGSNLIIWTTTPWTLPANTGVMVHPDVVYQEIEVDTGEKWIIATPLVERLLGEIKRKYTVVEEFKGSEMKGWNYTNPLASHLQLKVEKGYEVVLAGRYVTTEEGTGLVHCAPGHGKEDYDVGRQNGLDSPCPVGVNGILSEEAGSYAGKKAREVDVEIVADLKKEGYLVHQKTYEHDYPLCWRDKTPLLMVSLPQWFLKVSSIQPALLKENEKTIWNPRWAQSRMKAWLEGIGDWPISRQRYWGTPLPIWRNEVTGEQVVVGSIAELQQLSGKKQIDVHKPGIDDITIQGKTGVLKRVPEVLDVWFDSGASSWAALGYPSEKKLFAKYWPADVNIEGKDMIRGWWNSQFILSQLYFGKKPVDSIVMHGMVLDLGKKKMSKSVGNVVSPSDVIAKYGRDAMRYYFAKLSKGEDFAFNEKEFADITKIFMVLGNINTFVNQLSRGKSKERVEDRWILSLYNRLVKEVSEEYTVYHFPEVVQKLEQFLVFDLSRTYIQMIRERSDEVYAVLHRIRIGLLQLFAPIIPFYTEKLWQELREKGEVEKESVHLSGWPDVGKKTINEDLEKQFERLQKVIELGLAERGTIKQGLKWPLQSVSISGATLVSLKENEALLEVIAKQLNVKEVLFVDEEERKVVLDSVVTPELEAEGFSRELARKIQAERKNAGLQKGDMIDVQLRCDESMKKSLQKYVPFLKERINAKTFSFVDGKLSENEIVFTIREKKFALFFS